MWVKLDGNTAEDMLVGFKRRLQSVPESLPKTMSCDPDPRTAMHETLSAQLKMDISFCDPHGPWPRGSSEDANGLIRRHLPKGMGLKPGQPSATERHGASLNPRPRPFLNFHTPHEVFSALTAEFI